MRSVMCDVTSRPRTGICFDDVTRLVVEIHEDNQQYEQHDSQASHTDTRLGYTVR